MIAALGFFIGPGRELSSRVNHGTLPGYSVFMTSLQYTFFICESVEKIVLELLAFF